MEATEIKRKPAEAPEAGLTSADIEKLRQRFGFNELQQVRRRSLLQLFATQFTSLLIVILIVAAAIASVVGDKIDAIAISLVVLLNGCLGFVQEWRAENALAALRNLLAPRARVIRDGEEQIIDARELLPGDLVVLDAGDRVPADLAITTANQLSADESILTGESVPVRKSESKDGAELFMGTTIVGGRAEGVVTAIGAKTEIGKIADLTQSVEQQPTAMQLQLSRLARQLGMVAIGIAAGIVALGLLFDRPPVEMFMTGLSLAVALVPEGLPAVVTITLALGATAMARQKALARRLQAVETLGAASVICTDKTGTLTENKMTAAQIWIGGSIYRVTGTGYDPAGHIERDGVQVRAADDADLQALLRDAAICNHARLIHRADGWEMIGEPTEGALMTLAYKGWAELPDRTAITEEIPFSSDRKRMSVITRTEGGFHLFAKGAPEQMLRLSSQIRGPSGIQPLDNAKRDEIHRAFETMARDGLRVIAMAERDLPATPLPDPEQDLTFLGLVGLIDPPRPEVRAAVASSRAAGIRVVMITGDSPVTARAIASALDIPVEAVLSDDAVSELSDTELREALRRDVLFARTAPADKMRIVEALQQQGQIVAMTGDGVNDAPALKQANIGISMGIRGTDVAKDSSDIVLLDDNFATIVRAVREGRRQFDNVRKFVRYLLSSNAGEVVAILANILIGGPLIFLASQILWMNLVTDGVTAVALGLEKAEGGQMRRPPRSPDSPIVGRAGLLMILCFGAYTGAASLWVFYTFLPQGETVARTAAFTAMVLFEKVSVFAFRSFSQPCGRLGWASNPALLLALAVTIAAQVAAVYWAPLQLLLHTDALAWQHWNTIVALCLPLILVPELAKYVFQARPKASVQRAM